VSSLPGVVRFAPLALLLLGCPQSRGPEAPAAPKAELTDAQKAEIRGLISSRLVQVKEDRTARRAAIAAAKLGKAPCSIDITSFAPRSAGRQDESMVVATEAADFVWEKEPGSNEDPDTDHLLESDAKIMEERLRKPLGEGETPERVIERARQEFTPPVPQRHRLVLAVERYKRPKVLPDSQFSPGFVKGILYLYDQQDRRPLCGVAVEAESSELVKVHQFNSPVQDLLEESNLFGDVLVRAVAQGTQGMFAVEVPRKKR
jgi:hypothetical protein